MTTDTSLSAAALWLRLSPFLGTRARRRMAVLAVTTLLFSLFSVGSEVMLPLWVTNDLGWSASAWAQLRSLRFFGVVAGVIVLGALSDRFGQRMLGALSMLGTAVCLLLLRWGTASSLWVIMPIFGALVSTAFVNLNTLTQQVSARRQGLANAIYRSIGASTVIVAPVLVTRLGAWWHGYPSVFVVFAALLIIAALVLFAYPGEETPSALGNLTDEVRRLWIGYRAALRRAELTRFIHLSMIWGNLIAGVGAFFAIRFAHELRQGDQAFGVLNSVAGTVAFLATLGAAFFMDRVSLRKLHGLLGTATGLCTALLGLGDSHLLAMVGFTAFIAFTTILLGPSSMWVSRTAGAGGQVAAFSVHKILSALYIAVAMALLGLLERLIGIRAIFLYGGLLATLAGLAFFLLPEPPLPGKVD